MSVSLKHINMSYAEIMHHLRKDESLWIYMDSDLPLSSTLQDEIDYLKSMQYHPYHRMFAIMYDGIFVGYITLKNIAFGTAELSYCIMDKEFWGKGILSIATLRTLRYAFTILDLDMVYVYVNPENIASYKNVANKRFVRIGSSFIKPEVERLEMTKTGWKKTLARE